MSESENKTSDIQPFSEEELSALAKKLEEDKDFESDLARAVFTLLVVGFEYQNLYGTLQAYYSASQQACLEVASSCAKIIGIRDLKKIQKMYKIAGDYGANIPLRAKSILEEATKEVEETEEDNNK